MGTFHGITSLVLLALAMLVGLISVAQTHRLRRWYTPLFWGPPFW